MNKQQDTHAANHLCVRCHRSFPDSDDYFPGYSLCRPCLCELVFGPKPDSAEEESDDGFAWDQTYVRHTRALILADTTDALAGLATVYALLDHVVPLARRYGLNQHNLNTLIAAHITVHNVIRDLRWLRSQLDKPDPPDYHPNLPFVLSGDPPA